MRVDVIGLLQLRRIRQDVEIIEDVIVTHRESGTDRTLSTRAKDASQQSFLIIRRPCKAEFWCKVLRLCFWFIEFEDAGYRRNRIQDLTCSRTQGHLLIGIADAEIQG